jgi:AraC-like DNA-binding protein
MGHENRLDVNLVRETVRRQAARGQPTLDNVALELHISTRSLQRHLMREGMQYSQLVDQARLDLAMHLLRRPGMPIGDIAHQLGYADAGSFSRAFSRWTGQSPRVFRKKCSNQPVELS